LRVKRISGSTTTVTIFSGDLDIAEYVNGAAPSSPSYEYFYAGSEKIASIQSGTTYYFHNDHLSLRIRTDASGGVVDQRGHYPLGESWYSPSGASSILTTYHRDSESGNDYAMARFYASRLGRFLSSDPIAGSTADPQSLNRFSYTRNDPINLTDPSGMFIAPQLYSLMRLSNANMIGSLYSEFDIYTSWGCDESGEHCGHYINNDALAFLAILQTKSRGGGIGPKGLRLVRGKDCQDFGGRWVDYNLLRDGNPLPTDEQYSVSEHHTNTDLTPSTNQEANAFYDHISPGWLPGATVSNVQSFTIAPTSGGTSQSVIISIDNQDYGSLGIFTKNLGSSLLILINGKSAPSQMTGDKKCSNHREW
jgi:RHS repeat-associated protein